MLSYLSLAVINVVGIFFTPYLIKVLGSHTYGLYSIVGSLMAILSLINFGLGGTLVRFIAKYRGENDIEGTENLLGLSLILFTLLGAIMLLAGLVVSYNLETLFPNLLDSDIESVKLMFIILSASTAISLPGIVFYSVQVAYERFVFSKVLEIIKTIIRVGAIIGLLNLGHKAVAVIAVDAIVLLVIFLLNALYVHKKININIKLHKIDKSLLIAVFKYSFWFAVGSLVIQLTWSSGQLILARTGSATDVGVFAAAVAIAGYFIALATAISNMYAPRASFMEGAGAKDDDFSKALIKIGRSQLFIVGLFLVGFFAIGKDFIVLWLGMDYTVSYYVTCLLILPVVLNISQSFAYSVVQAKNLIALSAIIKLIFALISVIAAYFLSLEYGIIGVPVALASSRLISLLFLNAFYQYSVKLDIIKFVCKCWLPFFPVLVIASGSGWYLNNLLIVSTWFDLIVNAILVTLIYLTLSITFYLNAEERNYIYLFLRYIKPAKL